MRLKTLGFLAQTAPQRLSMLHEAGNPNTEERIRGRAGQRLRKQVYEQHCYLCVRCQQAGRVTHARHIDHRVPLEQGGSNDPSNLDPLCLECHKAKTIAEASARARRLPLSDAATARRLPCDIAPSRIPLTIVCGPPASGKSTYVRAHAGANDVAIDLDAINQRLSGRKEHDTAGTQWLAAELDERNRQLRALATDNEHDRAWFIVACPSPQERKHWADMMGATLVLLDVPFDECVRRIRSDATRAGHEQRMIDAAADWWRVNRGRVGGVS